MKMAGVSFLLKNSFARVYLRFASAPAAFLLVALMASSPPPVLGWFEKKGESGFALENLDLFGGDAAALAMGSAGQDYFNPASPCKKYHEELSVAYAPLFEGAHFFSMTYLLPFAHGKTLWTSVSALDAGFSPGTNELGEDTGSFTAGDILAKTGYSQTVWKDYSVGASVKYYARRISDYSASALSLDAGITRSFADDTVGFAVSNVPPASVGADRIYPTFRAGLVHFFPGKKASVALDAAAVGVLSDYTAYKWFAGAGFEGPENVFWRAGVNGKSVSAGFGVAFRRADFDYAVSYHPLGFLHAITVRARFSLEPSAAELSALRSEERLAEERAAAARKNAIEKQILINERERLARERKISAVYLAAARDFGDKKYARATEKLGEILKIDPKNEEAKRLLAEIRAITSEAMVRRKLAEMDAAYNKEDYPAVVETARWIMDAQPDREKARIYFFLANARMLIAEKKYIDAKGELFEVIKVQSTNAEALGLLKRIQTVMDMEGK